MEQSGNLPRRILDYLAYLKETLNFIFNNYGRRLVNADGDINELTRTAEETTSRLSDAEGNISTLQQTAEGLESRVEDAEGNISTLSQTTAGLTYEVFDAGSTLNTNISAVAGKVAIVVDSNDNIKAAEIVAAVNDAGSSVIISADHLDLNGYVTFTNLSTSGQTSIDGANITTGYISADRIEAGTITSTKLADAVNNAISTAQSTANGANSQEQVIYKQAVSGTSSMSGTTTWVTATGESVSSDTAGLTPVWTTKRPTYRSKYPVIFVATQRKTVGGTVTCTTPLKDDTVTVIDGGHITTGTIDASVATITNINADNISSGTLSADRIGAKTITSAKLADAVNTAISTAQSTANGANAQEQLIYISKASGTSSVSATTTWVTSTSDSQNAWTTKRPTYNSSYPVLFVATQRKTVGGTVTCTTPLKDDTTTVIDGGHITTGTIDASVATITNINASNISSGTLAAARIAAGSLAIGKLDTSTQSKINTALSRGVEYIVGTQTASTNAWTGVTTDASIAAGKSIAYYLPYAGTSSAATLNLTLSGGGTTGAKNVRINNSNVTTHYPAGTIINLTYDGTYWKADNYDSNQIDRTRYNSNIYALEAITAGHLIAGTASGYKMLAASLAFDLSYPILYCGTAIEASANGTNNYTMMSNINFSTTGTIQGGAAKKVLYLKGTVSGTTFTIAASNWLTTTVPSSADSAYYIPLGVMSSATNGSFLSSNQLWAYINGSFQCINTGAVGLADTANTRAVAYRGVCSTAATTAAKTVTCANFALVQGASVTVYNTTAQTKADAAITLNVNSTGAKTIYVAGAATSSTNQILWTANSTVTFTYDGTYWRIQDNPGVWYGSTCSVAAATAAKTTTVNEAVLYKGSMVYVPMTYANTSTSATLNVSSTGAKAVYYETGTTRPTTANGHGWIAGKSAAFVFDGAYWRISEGATYVDGGNIVTGTVLASSIKANETFTQNLTATNFNITGGTININTSDEHDDRIELNYVKDNTGQSVLPHTATFRSSTAPGGYSVSLELIGSGSNVLFEKPTTTISCYGIQSDYYKKTSSSAAYASLSGFKLWYDGLTLTESGSTVAFLDKTGLFFYDSSNNRTAYYNANGPTLTTSSATAVSVAHQTYKSVGSVSLAAGTWLIKATIAFAANATGTRYVVPSYTANSSSTAVDWSAEALCPAVPRAGFKTNVQTTFIVKHTETKTIYFNAWQDSGSALSTQLLYQTLKLA